MPFQSEKQRRYLHANHPEIAKRWERDYANGGILDINESEEIISDDGNDIELTDYNAAFDEPNDLSTGVRTLFKAKDGGQLVKPGPGRPGYGGPQDWGQEARREGPYSTGEVNVSNEPYRPTIATVSGPATVAPVVAPTTDDKGDDARSKYLSEQYKTEYDKYAGTDLEEQREIDQRDALRRLQSKNLTKQERKNLEVGVGIRKPSAPSNPLKTLGKVAVFWATLGASGLIEVPEIVQYAATSYNKYKEAEGLYNKYKKLAPDKYGLKDVSFDDIIAKAGGSFKENIEEYKRKVDLYNSLPDGHPEKIALSIELEIGKKPEHLGDGDQEIPRVEEITEELIEATEEGDAVDIMSVWDRIKNRQAKRSMLVEQGIIQGEPIALANSGGLANLFRVKNQY